ncbi:MAG: glutamate--tRNA ligase [candidate division NC10 bacterium]|nr:glutamate--tRNA ligase [candidate division NC10 bacterium]
MSDSQGIKGTEVRVRFAPSPTGYLHLGNARTALFNWLFARHHGGTFVLRIEDTDVERSSKESEEAILEDLRWLGLDWDEGPDVGGPHGPYRQSERRDIYQKYAQELLGKGGAYRCFCSEEELEAERRVALAAGRMPKYEGRCRLRSPEEVEELLASGRPYTIRFRVDPAQIVVEDLVRGRVSFESAFIGDFIIMRSDGEVSYNFAAVVDDAWMRITHVIRGEDHLPNTPRQLLLYKALGAEPPKFAHLSMILGPDHSPLSKRHGDVSVSYYRETGYLPEALANYLALLGWSSEKGMEIMPMEEIARQFNLKRVSKSAAIFDNAKLDWMSGNYIRKANLSRLTEMALPYLRRAGLIGEDYDSQWLEQVVAAVRAHISCFSQISREAEVFFSFDACKALANGEVRRVLSEPEALKVLEALKGELLKMERLTAEDYPKLVKALKAATGLQGRPLFHPIRAALTGKASGPELALLLPILGREECLRRLNSIIGQLER